MDHAARIGMDRVRESLTKEPQKKTAATGAAVTILLSQFFVAQIRKKLKRAVTSSLRFPWTPAALLEQRLADSPADLPLACSYEGRSSHP